ncbi:MAG: phytanoyl-CoA dioxygenase family protein [Leptospiraceae bacterium]|nr:phytanoyl-CoA dioxygenase family protein [Leptospiraceae bacterium]
MSKMLFVNPILSNLELKDLLFQGKIVKFTDCKHSKKLALYTKKFLVNKLSEQNIKEFEYKVSREKFHQILSNLKPTFSNSKKTKELVTKILKEIGFNLNFNIFDLVRLRSITSYAHTIPDAKPAFAVHRDTWYANSQSQINWWVPIFDVTEEDTFAFYPDYFSKPVKNNSNEFDYDLWNSFGGYQSVTSNESKVFPELQEKLDLSSTLKIPCRAGDLLLFSASHLHGTTPNTTNKTRFSVDFRTVDLEDLGKSGAPNVDNFSKGSIIQDMILATD